MKKHNERKYYVIIILVVAVYLGLVCLSSKIPGLSSLDTSELSAIVTTITALIAAVAFWLELKRTENLNEATFIMSLNDQFISNPELTKIEHALELYYNNVIEGKKDDWKLTLERSHEDCQKLINYLVYMECLSVLIKRNVMHLGIIDDLFAYRFFIAVNNPLVQEFELLPYANFYQGCFELSEMWTKQWRNKGRTIPLDQYALFECERSQKNACFDGRRKDDN